MLSVCDVDVGQPQMLFLHDVVSQGHSGVCNKCRGGWPAAVGSSLHGTVCVWALF